jgi:hypothetical protein
MKIVDHVRNADTVKRPDSTPRPTARSDLRVVTAANRINRVDVGRPKHLRQASNRTR